jgi:hypothetical protein
MKSLPTVGMMKHNARHEEVGKIFYLTTDNAKSERVGELVSLYPKHLQLGYHFLECRRRAGVTKTNAMLSYK